MFEALKALLEAAKTAKPSAEHREQQRRRHHRGLARNLVLLAVVISFLGPATTYLRTWQLARDTRSQVQHLKADNARLRAEGHALITGPLSGQPDQSLRGINVFRTSVEETRALMESDPSVQAGRLRFDVFTWYVPVGTLGDHPAAQIDV